MIDKKITRKEDCTGCYACNNICPKQCISMKTDSEGFWYPKVNYDECIECGLCVKVCPILSKKTIDNSPKAYACYNLDEKIRRESSSGGIFTLVANEILKAGGVVFGVGFDEDFRVVHSYIDSIEDLEKYRVSKYVQSSIVDSYKRAKEFLVQKREVLFTGTPCQIAGLKSYLNKEYSNLLCIDNICHGVPSPKVWDKYTNFRKKEANSEITKVSFRNKSTGWTEYSMSFVFKNGIEYSEPSSNDLYMKAFLRNVSLRPSCYECKFKSTHRESDITLADFWGIQKVLPNMYDNKGTSLIFVNSKRGSEILERIKGKIRYEEVSIDESIKYNSPAIRSVYKNPNRDDFFSNLDKLEFDKLIEKYCYDSLKERIKRKIINILIKMKSLIIDHN